MKTIPIENGVAVEAETEFEEKYLSKVFTLVKERVVSFNHELGQLRVYVEYTTPLKEEEE
jgi:hypothetical protein